MHVWPAAQARRQPRQLASSRRVSQLPLPSQSRRDTPHSDVTPGGASGPTSTVAASPSSVGAGPCPASPPHAMTNEHISNNVLMAKTVRATQAESHAAAVVMPARITRRNAASATS